MVSTPFKLPRRVFLLGALAAGIMPLANVLASTASAATSRATATSPSAATLGPLVYIPQTYNNCGPAAIAEVLAYWGISRTQGQVQAALRVDGPIVGMTPYGIPAYARGVGLRSLLGVGGGEALIKALVARGFPVIVHQVVSLADPTGHWRPVEAYDDRQDIFVTSDPYLGPNYRISYSNFAQMWTLRGYSFFILYPASRQAALSAAMAAGGWNKAAAYTHDLALLRASQWDASPVGSPASASGAYRYLGMAWDAAQLGRAAQARTYLRLAAGAGANPIEVRWVNSQIA
jgi:hypothetical protein